MRPSAAIDAMLTQSYACKQRRSYSGNKYTHHSQVPSLNADGFGIGFPGRTFKHETPMFLLSKNNREAYGAVFDDLAGVRPCEPFFVHVRAATGFTQNCPGATQPFVMKPLTFMHNGYLENYESFKKRVREVVGPEQEFYSDSAMIAALLECFYKEIPEGEGGRLETAVRKTIRKLLEVQPGPESEMLLNFAVYDGSDIVATRFASPGPNKAPTLYIYDRDGKRGLASEPLELEPPEGIDTESWKEVPEGSIVTMVIAGGACGQPCVRPLSLDEDIARPLLTRPDEERDLAHLARVEIVETDLERIHSLVEEHCTITEGKWSDEEQMERLKLIIGKEPFVQMTELAEQQDHFCAGWEPKRGFTRVPLRKIPGKMDVMFVLWEPGCYNEPHSHGGEGSQCIFKVLCGKLTEQLYEMPKSGMQEEKPLKRLGKKKTLRKGQCGLISDSIGLHDVKAPERAVSLHIYIPGYEEFHRMPSNKTDTVTKYRMEEPM